MGRVISVALQFVDGFTRPSREVIKNMTTMANNIKKNAKEIQNAGKVISDVGSTLTKSITLPIAGVATAAVKTAADFEQSMSQVAATMGKTKEDVKGLSKLAKQMGATTAFSASEAAEGINILAMAGLNATQIGDSLGTVLDLSAAGAMDMGSSASYIAGAVKGFGDEMKNASKYADLMAKGATLANTDVAQLGEAISYGAATAKGYSQSADSMTLALLRMAEQNVIGQTAATSLNRAMADLYSPTAEAKKALDSLNISAYNADGSARDFNIIVDELSGALKGMSEQNANALKSTIFTTNGMNAFNKMTASTSKRVNELTEGLKAAGGSAAQQAKTQLDNLKGQITLLKSAIEGILITVGDKLMPYVTIVVEWVQKAADYINNLSDAQVDNIIKWAGMAAAIGPVIMVFEKAVTMVGKIQGKFADVIKIFTKFKGAIGLITSPAAVVIGVLAGIAFAAFLIIKNWDQVKGFLQGVGDWFKNAFEKAGFTVGEFKDKFSSIKDTIGRISGKIGDICKSVAGIFKKEFARDVKSGMAQADSALQSFVGGAVTVFDGIVTAIDKGLQAFDALLSFFTGAFVGDWDNAAQGFRDSMQNIFPPDMAAGLTKAFDTALPVIEAAVSGVKEAFGGLLQDVKKIFGSIGDAFGGFGTMFKGIFSGDAETALKGFQTAAGGILDAIGNKIKLKINVVKNFVVGAISTFLPDNVVNKIANVFDIVGSKWDIAIETAKNCIDKFVQAIKPLIENVKTVFEGVAQFVKGVFTGNWKGALNGLKTVASGALSGLITIIKAPFKAIADTIKSAVGSFKNLNIVKSIFTGVGNAIRNVLTKSGIDVKKFSETINNIKTRVGNIINGLKTIFSTVFNVIGKVVKTLAATIANVFGKRINSTCGTAKAVLIAFKATAGAAFSAIAANIKKAMNIIVPVVKVAFEIVKNAIANAVNTITSVISGVLTVFDGIITFISGVFTGNWRKAWEGVKDIFKGILDTFAAICKAPINAVIGIINGAITGINKLGLTIPDWVPVIGGQDFRINVPTIPMLYKGTDNWRGGVAMIHDRGGEIVDLPQGTRVYPHDKSVEMARREGASQSGNISITIQKLADKIEVRNDADIDRIAEALAYKLKKVAFNMGTA